jgi:uncharacterized membrane protein AbrB (regulator of aidB expression)
VLSLHFCRGRRSGLPAWLAAVYSESVLAFSPGGQAEMAIVAWWGRTLPLSWRTHLVRIVFVIIGAPPVNHRFD